MDPKQIKQAVIAAANSVGMTDVAYRIGNIPDATIAAAATNTQQPSAFESGAKRAQANLPANGKLWQ